MYTTATTKELNIVLYLISITINKLTSATSINILHIFQHDTSIKQHDHHAEPREQQGALSRSAGIFHREQDFRPAEKRLTLFIMMIHFIFINNSIMNLLNPSSQKLVILFDLFIA